MNDKVLTGLAFLFPLLGALTAFACVLTDVDAIYVILDEYCLPDRFYRGLFLTVIQTITRFVLYLVVFSDVLRGVGLFVSTWLIFLTRINLITSKLQRKRSLTTRTLQEYNLCYLLVMTVLGNDIDKILYVFLFSLFWIPVGCIWLILTTSPSVISYSLYLTIFGLAIVCILIFFVMFPLLSAVTVNSTRFLVLQRFIAAYKYGKFRFSMNKAFKQKLLSMRPLVLHYGKFEVIDKKFLVDYIWNIGMRSIDAILFDL